MGKNEQIQTYNYDEPKAKRILIRFEIINVFKGTHTCSN